MADNKKQHGVICRGCVNFATTGLGDCCALWRQIDPDMYGKGMRGEKIDCTLFIKRNPKEE